MKRLRGKLWLLLLILAALIIFFNLYGYMIVTI